MWAAQLCILPEISFTRIIPKRNLTRICDWRDTVIGPFGVSLGGLETMLGIYRRRESWCHHANQQELRDGFWKALLDAMEDVTDDLV